MTLPAPSPRSWDPGDIGSVTYLNENIRDAFGFLLAPPVFIGSQSASQSIPNNAFTAMTWDYSIVDTYNGHQVSANPNLWTVPFAGVWLVRCNVAFQANATGRRLAQIVWNGSSAVQTEVQVNAAGGITNALAWWQFEGEPGDTFQVNAFQTSGGALSTQVAPAAAASYFEIRLVGGHI